MTCVYLETTALIDTVLKGWYPELAAIINDADRVTTSQYTKMEIKKGFLRHWVLLYNKTVQYQSIEKVHLFISNLTRSPQRYYLGACADAITLFTSKYSSNRPSTLADQYGEINEGEIQLRIFKSILRTQIKRCFHKISKLVDEVYNPMNCFQDIHPPLEQDGVFFNKPEKCHESKRKCDIKKFIEDNARPFSEILAKLETLHKKDDETKRRISSLKAFFKMIRLNRDFDNTAPNQKHCWNCGDAIHAVIPRDDEIVISCNRSHFEPICEAIDRTTKGYSSPSS